MALWVVDPDWYFQTAAILSRAASKLATATGILADNAVLGTNNMAGNDPVGTGWGTRYDTLSADTVNGAASLSRACSALASRIYQAGVNHAWAEFEAGRSRLPSPSNLPPKPAISTPSNPSLASAVGDNGPGLAVSLPGLEEAVGSPVPNAETHALAETATSWTTFSQAISEAVDDVIHQVRRPDPSLPDASAFYESIAGLSAPGDALSADALSLSGLAQNFSAGVSSMRNSITVELYATAIMIGGVAAVAALGSRVAGSVSVGIGMKAAQRRINAAGQNIRGFISTLQGVASLIDAFTPAFQPAMKSELDKQSLIPAEGFERNPDGTIKPTIRYFDAAKWAAWQRYLERGGDMDIDTWSRLYDQLKENATSGYWWDKHYVPEIMGYNKDQGWTDQFGSRREDLDEVPVPGRVWDWANPDTQELVENKSGRLDFDQLAKDEIALRDGWNVTWNINGNYPYTANELAALARLEELYPGQFTVNRL